MDRHTCFSCMLPSLFDSDRQHIPLSNKYVKLFNKINKRLLNTVEQSDIFNIMKEITVQKGVRFPVSLIAEIDKIKKTEKRGTFSVVVLDLCWKGVDRYYYEKGVIKTSDENKRETSCDVRAK